MSENPGVRQYGESPRRESRNRPYRWGLFLAVLAVIGASSMAVAQELPQGGTTQWEMEELEVVLTFLLFDP
jgi:NhaP-type Na+/H+ or K+/H+ antiporter